MASRLARSVAASALAAAAAGVVAGSCREAITDEVVDVREQFCGTLADCGLSSSCRLVEAALGESEDVAEEVLVLFNELGCAEACGAAAECLADSALCVELGTGCKADVECCDAPEGLAVCGAGDDVGCCKPLAVLCEADEECCPDGDALVPCVDVAVDGGDVVATCGGLPPCALVGEECALDGDCCSGQCVAGECVRTFCIETGDKCTAGRDECCTDTDQCGASGVCEPPDVCAQDPQAEGCCAEAGDGCADRECCARAGDGSALACYPLAQGGTQCGDPTCPPRLSLCELDTDCCPDDPSTNWACVFFAELDEYACDVLPCIDEEGAACGDRPCCNGLQCVDGACARECGETACHSPFAFGPPMPPEGCNEDPPGCIATVCEQDASCCCAMWDTVCTDIAVELCGQP
jgi:hypothetical protein